MKVYGALEVAQLEWFTNAGKPAASSYPYRAIYVSDLKQIQVSDGTNWNADVVVAWTSGTLPSASSANQYQWAYTTDDKIVYFSNGTTWIPINPMTTAGDIIYGGTSGIPTRLANGTSGQFLKSNGGTSAPAWANVTITNAIATKTTTYSITTADYTINCDATGGAFTVTLPTAVGITGQLFVIRKVDSTFSAITIATTSSQTIDGVTTRTLSTQYDSMTVQSNGSNWVILNRTIPQIWTSYTPTFTGFGTATSIEFQYKRSGSDLLIRGKFTAGTSTATEARVSLPSGLTSESTGVIPSIQYASSAAVGYNGAANVSVMIEPSKTYVVFGYQTPSSSGLTKVNGDSVLPAGNTMSFSTRVPISGWEG